MNCQTHNRIDYRVSQRGGALLVALVMLFMLSIMGISSMRGSTLERRMASNSVQTSTTFQGAESTSEVGLNTPANLAAAFEAGKNNGGGRIPVNLLQDINMESSAEITYVSDGPAYGFSWGIGNSNFVALRFVADGDARIDAVRARARVTQGAYRIVPAP